MFLGTILVEGCLACDMNCFSFLGSCSFYMRPTQWGSRASVYEDRSPTLTETVRFIINLHIHGSIHDGSSAVGHSNAVNIKFA